MYVNPVHHCNCLMIVIYVICSIQNMGCGSASCVFHFLLVHIFHLLPQIKILVVGGGVTFEVSRSGRSVWTTMISPLTCEMTIQIHFHKHSRMHTEADGGPFPVYIQSLFIFFVNLTLENWFSVHMTFLVGNTSQIIS
jgi:hypothetical protein